jgi:two-component sensor histidine kinase
MKEGAINKSRHTLRFYIHSQLMTTIMLCSLISAAGVYAVGEVLFGYLYDRAIANAFSVENHAINLFDTIAGSLDTRARSVGAAALVELGQKYHSEDAIARASSEDLAAEAKRLDIGDIYLIGPDGKVAATNFAADRGLDMFSLGDDFKAFLLSIAGKGNVTSQSLSLSTRTGHINMYQYYSPPGSAVLIEISTSLRSLFARAFPGIGYEEVISQLFDLASAGGDGKLVWLADVLTYGPGNYRHWSLLRDGTAGDLPEEVLTEAIQKGESRRVRGERETFVKLTRLDRRNVDFFNAQFLAVFSIDLRPIDQFRLICLVVGLGVAALISAFSWMRARRNFSRHVTKRIEAIVQSLEEMGVGTADSALDHSGGDELSAISRGIYAMISSLVEKNRELEKLSEERKVLLMEVEHRVRNNLQILSSLVDLQARDETDAAVRGALVSIHVRILGMSIAHDQISKSDTAATVDMGRYFGDLARSIVDMKVGPDREVAVKIDAKGIELPPDFAIPLGLSVGELIANACDHAFPDHEGGLIGVDLERGAEGLTATVSDDGVGTDSPRRGLGIAIIGILCEQLGGTFRLQARSPRGTSGIISVPDPSCAARRGMRS